MGKNYYAIKDGNGVENLIVTSWEECQKYVLSYPAIYKGFNTRFQAEEYLGNMTEEDVKKAQAVKQLFADNNKRARYIKKENKALHEVYDKYDGLYDSIAGVMDKLESENYDIKEILASLNSVEADILEGLDKLHRYIDVFEKEN